jgi:hypothetical protein
MTGWLSAFGIVLILLASLYAGLASSSNTNGGLQETVAVVAPESIDVGDGGIAAPPGELAPTPGPAEPDAPAVSRPDSGPPPGSNDILNRQDCERIRGTDYVSQEELTWYLSNCVRR